MIPNPCIEVQTSPVDRPWVPAWFAEVVIIAQHLATKGLLDAFAHQVGRTTFPFLMISAEASKVC